jgi:KAP family P-loop domain
VVEARIDLWDDNPSTLDMLGFDAVVQPVLAALEQPDLDPLTISVQSPWGGGKSTILELLYLQLKDQKRYIVVRTSPWEYDDHDDVRGTLIAEVLAGIEASVKDNAALKEKVKHKVTDLARRISWGRVAHALAKGAITMQWDYDEMIKAFTPKDAATPDSMAGFRSSYKELLNLIPGVERVIVLVDDVDRCLPDAVTATLEAIKLFLSVKKMIFVLAADQEMIREAIAASLGASNRSDRFAQRYLEKIVQLPIALPRLTPADAEAYIGLLLAARDRPSDEALVALASHVTARRNSGNSPLLADFGQLSWAPSSSDLTLAAQLAQGLRADRLANPRQIKRILNAFGVRQSIARSRGVSVSADVLVKMLLLEDQHRSSFETLAATPAPERAALLEAWEAWAHGAADATNKPPTGIADETRHWADSPPSLAHVQLGTYLALAASLLDITMGTQVSDATVAFVRRLLSESEADRESAAEALSQRPVEEQRAALTLLFAEARRSDDATIIVAGACLWAQQSTELVDDIAAGIQEDCWGSRLTSGAIVDLFSSGIPALQRLVHNATQDTTLEPGTRQAAVEEVGSSHGD